MLNNWAYKLIFEYNILQCHFLRIGILKIASWNVVYPIEPILYCDFVVKLRMVSVRRIGGIPLMTIC